MSASENTGTNQGGRFKPGQSGNPAGKPAGARHRATLAIEALLEGEAEAIGRKCIEKALEGDGIALKLAMERIAPVPRGRPVRFALPPLNAAGDLPKAIGALLAAVADGDVTPDEAVALAHIVEVRRRAIETAELETRIAALEATNERS